MRTKFFRPVSLIFSIFYVLLMLWLLFGQRIGNAGTLTYVETLKNNYNLHPFHTISNYYSSIKIGPSSTYFYTAIINIIGNIIMFIPLGFFVAHLWRPARRSYRFIITILTILLAIETLQFFTLLGSFDIDDILLNSVGAILGFILFHTVKQFTRSSVKQE